MLLQSKHIGPLCETMWPWLTPKHRAAAQCERCIRAHSCLVGGSHCLDYSVMPKPWQTNKQKRPIWKQLSIDGVQAMLFQIGKQVVAVKTPVDFLLMDMESMNYWAHRCVWLIIYYCFHLMSNQNPLKTNINKYKYPVSSCTCAIMRCMCPFEWVNNHAEKPYVQSVGCPTFRDDDVRWNIIGFFVVVVVSGFFFFFCGGGACCFRTMPRSRLTIWWINIVVRIKQNDPVPCIFFLEGWKQMQGSLGFVGLCTIAQTQIHLFQH